ncbi:hypothetical protein H5410_056322 [Solanum commersonii]|uniref:Uncharacterized protein n=1 Tax=Solanum commersonii TaxID=4109 RepID=A0A9J5WLX7_SOLCO|nr:hypothetical protein H5410_056322 [Solanum commersonii]
MWESVEDPHPSASLPYVLLISRILVDRLLDISMFTHVENKWVKKDSAETSKPTKICADLAALLMQDNDELKTRLLRDTTTAVGKLLIVMTRIKHEGIYTVNKLIRQVDSLKGGVSSFNNDLAFSVHTSYSSLSRGQDQEIINQAKNRAKPSREERKSDQAKIQDKSSSQAQNRVISIKKEGM